MQQQVKHESEQQKTIAHLIVEHNILSSQLRSAFSQHSQAIYIVLIENACQQRNAGCKTTICQRKIGHFWAGKLGAYPKNHSSKRHTLQ